MTALLYKSKHHLKLNTFLPTQLSVTQAEQSCPGGQRAQRNAL